MKKILSIVLVVVMLFSCASTAFAQNERDFAPAILITGMANSDLVRDLGLETEKQVFGAEEDVMQQMIIDLIPGLVFFLLGGSFDIFSKALVKAVTPVFEPIRYTPEGESAYNIDIDSENYPRYSLSAFHYDWRKDPMEVAAELDAFIQEVKAFHGTHKVTLVPESMGGVVASAYFYLYGYDDIESVVFRSTAMYGVSMVGELFTGQVSLDSKSLLGYLNGFLLGDGADMIMARGTIKTLGAVLLNPLISKIDRFFTAKRDFIYDELLIDVFGYLPGLWSFVSEEYYEEAKDFMLDETQCAGLIEKIDLYHYQVRPAIDSTLEKMMADGVSVSFISHYGFSEIPVSDARYMTDALIDTKNTSAGAICSRFDDTLGEDYVQSVNDGHNHLSPDMQIDASTCLFPERTWFIKGLFHTFYNDDYEELVYWLLKEGADADVYSNPRFPQFMINNADDTLSPMTEDNTEFNNDEITFDVIVDFVKGLAA